MIDDSDRLKPCPFCGGAAEMGCVRSESGEEPNEGGYFIACLACDASTGLRFACGDDPKPLLIEQWNRRTALAQQAEPVPAWRRAWKHAAVLEAFVGADANGRVALDALYRMATPPQRKPLTEEEMHRLYRRAGLEAYYPRDGVVQYDYEKRLDAFARAVERAHGIGGDDGKA